MARSTKPWEGASDDTPIPPRVKLRVKSRANECCQNCHLRSPRGDVDHKQAIINGGTNSEANLQWLCLNCHRAKTKSDVALKSRAAKRQIRMAGIKPQSQWSKRYHAQKEWKRSRDLEKREMESEDWGMTTPLTEEELDTIEEVYGAEAWRPHKYDKPNHWINLSQIIALARKGLRAEECSCEGYWFHKQPCPVHNSPPPSDAERKRESYVEGSPPIERDYKAPTPPLQGSEEWRCTKCGRPDSEHIYTNITDSGDLSPNMFRKCVTPPATNDIPVRGAFRDNDANDDRVASVPDPLTPSLVGRLREAPLPDWKTLVGLCHEAADALEAAQDRQVVWDEITKTQDETIAALRAENERLQIEADASEESIHRWMGQNERLRAENETLRKRMTWGDEKNRELVNLRSQLEGAVGALENADDLIELICPDGPQTQTVLAQVRAAIANIREGK